MKGGRPSTPTRTSWLLVESHVSNIDSEMLEMKSAESCLWTIVPDVGQCIVLFTFPIHKLSEPFIQSRPSCHCIHEKKKLGSIFLNDLNLD